MSSKPIKKETVFRGLPKRRPVSEKKKTPKKWDTAIRSSTREPTSIYKCRVEDLPIYGKKCFGTMCWYGPPASGKTTLMSDVVENMIKPLRENRAGDDDIKVVVLFCPGERPEFQSLKTTRGFVHVKDGFAAKLHRIMQDQERMNQRGIKRKLLLLWDDLFGLVNMNSKEYREICNTLGAKARQPETNIVWAIASQYPRFLSTGVRSNTHMSFFSNVSPDHIKMILSVQNSHIKPDSLYRIAHSHQFVAVDNLSNKVYLTKADVSTPEEAKA